MSERTRPAPTHAAHGMGWDVPPDGMTYEQWWRCEDRRQVACASMSVADLSGDHDLKHEIAALYRIAANWSMPRRDEARIAITNALRHRPVELVEREGVRMLYTVDWVGNTHWLRNARRQWRAAQLEAAEGALLDLDQAMGCVRGRQGRAALRSWVDTSVRYLEYRNVWRHACKPWRLVHVGKPTARGYCYITGVDWAARGGRHD